jgi:hypothetical protein
MTSKDTPDRLRSVSPSPSTEEDVSRAQIWYEGDNEAGAQRRGRERRKGKERESAMDQPYAELIGSEESVERQDYPPMNDDITETRRVEEVSIIFTISDWY